MGLFQSLFGGRGGTAVPGVQAVELSAQLKEDADVFLLDVRSPYEYQHDGHIAGAHLLPLQNLMRDANELPPDKDIVVVCRSGNRSMVACQQLMAMGFDRVKNFDGGMIAWQIAGLPISK